MYWKVHILCTCLRNKRTRGNGHMVQKLLKMQTRKIYSGHANLHIISIQHTPYDAKIRSNKHQKGWMAQRFRQETSNSLVVGSKPSVGSQYFATFRFVKYSWMICFITTNCNEQKFKLSTKGEQHFAKCTNIFFISTSKLKSIYKAQ